MGAACERTGQIFGSHWTFALIQHFDVAAERHSREHIFGTISTGHAREKCAPETHREAQHLEA